MQTAICWRRRLCSLALATATLVAPRAAQGATLDWDLFAWPTTGTRTQTYTVGGGDVIVTVSDVNGVIDGGGGPAGSPGAIEIGSFLDPVGNNGEANLFIKTDANTAAPWVEVRFDFTHVGGVTDVTFSILDVDVLPHIFPPFIFFGYTDDVSVTASDGTNSFDPASVTAQTATPSWSFDGANTITGTANADQSGGNSADGTVDLLFAAPAITSISVIYRNTLTQGEAQWIGFTDVNFFEEGPEPSTGLLFGMGLIMLTGWRRHTRTAPG